MSKLEAVNSGHAYANELYHKIRKVFEPFVGQQIDKAAGGLMAKVQKHFDALDLPCTPSISVHRYGSEYSLVYIVKTCKDFEGHAFYHETSVYVGHTRHGVLTSFYDPPNFKTDYKVEDVIAAREKYKLAKKASDEAFSNLHPFGEYDR